MSKIGTTILLALISISLHAAEPMPVFTKDARILFQGDSITDGNRGRNADPNHILGHGYQFIIACKFGGKFPERNLVFMNRGVSGNKVTDLEKRWQKDTLDLKPDVLSILIGVNDSSSVLNQKPGGVTAEEYEKVYDALLQQTIAAFPKIKIVLCEPFVLPVGNVKARWEDWRTEVKKRSDVVEKLAVKYKLPVVHFQKMFDDACAKAPPEYWIWDGVHPTYNGHQLMADEWERTVEKFWAEAK